MLSLRVTRDRRGYEHVYLVFEVRRKGRSEGRLLYWSRTPGPLRVGREVLDADTRADLERANPDVAFDWPGLLKQLQSSTAAARWAAHQQRAGQVPGLGPGQHRRRNGEGRSLDPQRRDAGTPGDSDDRDDD